MRLTVASRTIVLLALALHLSAARQPAVAYEQSVDALARGKLLVARESLRDPNFSRTVLLILSYDETGAAAVVLNRPSHMTIDHLLPHLDLPEEARDTVYIGGPVAVRKATILANAEELQGAGPRIIGDIHMAADLAVLERMVTEPQPGERFRVYGGHAGWAPGQLEHEIRRGSWYVFPGSEAVVFSEAGDELWESFIRQTRSLIAQGRLSGGSTENLCP